MRRNLSEPSWKDRYREGRPHEDCHRQLPVIESRRCRKCGKPVEDFEALCPDCEKNPHQYDRGIGIYRYDSVMREAVSYLKYKGRREYGEAMGVYAAESARSELMTWNPEIIVPIPIHPARLRERGYNQAEVIARAVSEVSGIRLAPDALQRKDTTSAMKNLSVRERYSNLSNATVIFQRSLWQDPGYPVYAARSSSMIFTRRERRSMRERGCFAMPEYPESISCRFALAVVLWYHTSNYANS